MKKYVGIFLIAVLGAFSGAGIMKLLEEKPTVVTQTKPILRHTNNYGPAVANHPIKMPTSTGATVVENPDFVAASTMATPAVVHIKSSYNRSTEDDPFGGFFGRPRRGQSSGSGVIISDDGYIVTNNHVIDNAEAVEVVLNDKRSFKARVIGKDPTTDLALLKIKGEGHPHLKFGNSDQVQVGEWVLAVGNPFNLTSTVTAGIVSAKGRNLNLLNEEFAIESFLQTDAAVNPGNSGGALINTQGQLVGINTAIASETGSYAGYSFAIPAKLVRKVTTDLKEFGKVQRGIIGVQIQNINADVAERFNLNTLDGALISGIMKGGAAENAGLKRGDVIVAVEDQTVSSSSELQELIGIFRPGDKVSLGVLRDGNEIRIPVTLRDRNGNTSLSFLRDNEPSIADADSESEELGAVLEPITVRDKQEWNIESGVKVKEIRSGKLQEVGIEDGFIITRVNKEYVDSPNEVEKLVADSDGSILIEGISKEGVRQFFAFDY